MKLSNLIYPIVFSLLFLAQSADAAFCALRDPIETIETLFPSATSHKSVIRVVGEKQRQAVSDQLPPNALHFSELGQHTLYMAFNGQTPLGYLHVRSEESEWGLVEVAWALTLDLKVKDFRFQRCRSRARRAIEATAFRDQLTGKSYDELRLLLAADGINVNKNTLQVPREAEALAGVVLRCGLKTLLVTELVWTEEVAKNALIARAIGSFDDATALEPVSELELKKQYQAIVGHFPGQTTGMSLEGSELFSVTNASGAAVGAVFRHPIALSGPTDSVEWHINPDGEVVSIEGFKSWPDEDTALAFAAQLNSKFTAQTSCTDRPTLLTKQAVLMSMLAFQP